MSTKLYIAFITLYTTNFIFCLLTFIFYETDIITDKIVESKYYSNGGSAFLILTSVACIVQYLIIVKRFYFPKNKPNINSIEWKKHVKRERMEFINTTNLYRPNIKDLIEKFTKYMFTISFSIAIAIYFFVSEYDKRIWLTFFSKKDFFILSLKLAFSFLYLLQVFSRPDENHTLRKARIFVICFLISWGTIFLHSMLLKKKTYFVSLYCLF